jgi:hypothetical protein
VFLNGTGFLYLQCLLLPGEILEGKNEIVFFPANQLPEEVIVREMEIRIHPHITENMTIN